MFEGATKNNGQVLGGFGVKNLQEGRGNLEMITVMAIVKL